MRCRWGIITLTTRHDVSLTFCQHGSFDSLSVAAAVQDDGCDSSTISKSDMYAYLVKQSVVRPLACVPQSNAYLCLQAPASEHLTHHA
jgi:hypothetical protein